MHRDHMLAGEPYRPDDPELVADRLRCQQVVEQYNNTSADSTEKRHGLLTRLLGGIGTGTVLLPRVQFDYGYNVWIGDDTFVNHDAILLDCGPIFIGHNVQIGPRVQLLTALHPMDDHARRRQGWESSATITIGDNVWFGGGVIVCPGVTIGRNTVVGAGSVVTRSLPDHIFAAGNPCRIIRELPTE